MSKFAKTLVLARVALPLALPALAADYTKGTKGPQKDALTPLELSSVFHSIGQAQQNHTTTGSSILDWIMEALDHFDIKVTGPATWKIGTEAVDATITTKFNLNKDLTRVWEAKLVQRIGAQSGGTQHDLVDISRITRYAARLNSNRRK